MLLIRFSITGCQVRRPGPPQRPPELPGDEETKITIDEQNELDAIINLDKIGWVILYIDETKSTPLGDEEGTVDFSFVFAVFLGETLDAVAFIAFAINIHH